MTNKYNRLRVLYAPGETVAIAPQAYAHNSGQVLEVYGLPCDDQTVKVSFAAEGDTEAVPVVATVTGGVLSVGIPDSVLAGSGRNYKVRAFFHIVETDAVTTKYTVIIPVIDEPGMADETPTPSQQGEIDTLIAEMNTAAGRAEEAAEKAEEAAEEATKREGTGYIYPEDYGAKGDGETDDTAAVQEAVQASAETGREVYFTKTYLIDGIAADDVMLHLAPGAVIRRKDGGADPFICVNPNRPSGYITKRSIITGGTIDANGAGTAISVNGSEQMTVENVQVCQAHTGLHLARKTATTNKYNIESRINKVKFVNRLTNPAEYLDSVGIIDDGTDSQFSDIIVQNFKVGMKISGGGNSEIASLHHWLVYSELFDGSCTFRLDSNGSGFFSNCCSDSIETFFSMGTYARALVAGASQCRNYLMPEKKNMVYLAADSGEGMSDAAKTIWFFSYGSAHRGNAAVGVQFAEVSDNIYNRYTVQGPLYTNRLIIDGASISTMAPDSTEEDVEMPGKRNLIPFGYAALGALKNFSGSADLYKRNFDFNSEQENGLFGIQMSSSSNGPDGVTTGVSNLMVSGTEYAKMQLLINNTSGMYYRFYNGSWQPWRVLGDVIATQVPAIRNFSGSQEATWMMNCDMNDLTTPGMYGIQTSTATHKPSEVTSGTLNVWVGGTNAEANNIMSLIQMAITKDSIYTRVRAKTQSGWTWTEWAKIAGGGASGKTISYTELNSDYTLTIHYTDSTSDTVGPIQGAQGPQGIQGPAGDPITIESSYHDGTQTRIYFSDGTELTIPDGQQGQQGEPGEAIMITSVEHDGDAGVTAISFSDETKIDIPDGRPGESITVQSSYHDDMTGKTYITFSDGNEVEIPDGAQGPAGPAGATGPQGPQGPTGPQGPAYTLTAADKAAIVAAIEADYDNGDTSSYGS